MYMVDRRSSRNKKDDQYQQDGTTTTQNPTNDQLVNVNPTTEVYEV